MDLLQRAEMTALMVIDIQDNHYPHCINRQAALDTMVRVIEAAKAVEVPILLTEHYPKAFGRTIAAIAAALPGAAPLAKLHFACLSDPAIRARVEELDVRRLVLVGAETHICICQTALMGLELGYEVAVVADAVTGRRAQDHDLALARMRARGVDVISWEMLVYEWMRQGGTELFKRILPLVKQ